MSLPFAVADFEARGIVASALVADSEARASLLAAVAGSRAGIVVCVVSLVAAAATAPQQPKASGAIALSLPVARFALAVAAQCKCFLLKCVAEVDASVALAVCRAALEPACDERPTAPLLPQSRLASALSVVSVDA